MISFTWKYPIFLVIQIFIIICYFLQFLFCIGFGYNDVTINILQYELLLIFLWSLFSAIHESGTFNLFVLFLYKQVDICIIRPFHVCCYSAYCHFVQKFFLFHSHDVHGHLAGDKFHTVLQSLLA